MTNKTVICMSNPMKYLDNKFLIESIEFSTLEVFLSATKTMTIFSSKPLSFKKKNDIKMTENTPIVNPLSPFKIVFKVSGRKL
tara:strand:+ start:305 stop:553 length:249 start_codon:yes stop_codon:yes gene_type:complete